MSLGFVPGNSRTALRPTATHPRRCSPAPLRGGSGPFHLPLRLRDSGGRWPRLSASAFRARSAVGEGARAKGSFYELLGISESGSSVDDIKRAYKLMARKYHPDVSPPDRAEEYTRRFIEVHEAYETLSDPRLRALYDRDLARGLHLAFSARRRADEEVEERSGWRSRWQDQLSELKRRNRNNDSEGNLSWGARMRRQRPESSH
ncbi:chaperone protein dnaJ 20, chloroplastic-like [Canna indica]|uniref:Chaperone protein dnaJ 20, chloroplastic-like n=1 Tax=Canna indica TaxID=4628 RepID=A0AAQ3QB19_9LILI|nr:chaperone protein dnaJ 20, chloroplastic-like [Canna indica]